MKGGKKNIIRIALISLFTVAFCPSASAGIITKYELLLRFFDMNEADFAYQRHCLNNSKGINKKFIETLDYVADELLAEATKENPSIDPEYIKAKILERRYNLQYKLDHENMMNGCNTSATDMAKAHYEEFSRYNRQEIHEFWSAPYK